MQKSLSSRQVEIIITCIDNKPSILLAKHYLRGKFRRLVVDACYDDLHLPAAQRFLQLFACSVDQLDRYVPIDLSIIPKEGRDLLTRYRSEHADAQDPRRGNSLEFALQRAAIAQNFRGRG